MRVILIGIAMAIVGVFVYREVLACADITIEREGWRLTVPDRYAVKKRFPWIEQAEGLDRDPGRINIRVPREEVEAILADGAPLVSDLVVGLKLLDASEMEALSEGQISLLRDIQGGHGRFVDAKIRKDPAAGWFLLYENPQVTFRWYVLNSDQPTETSDVIGLCTRSIGQSVTCSLQTIMVDRVAVEVAVDERLLPYRGLIEKFLVDKVRGWVGNTEVG